MEGPLSLAMHTERGPGAFSPATCCSPWPTWAPSWSSRRILISPGDAAALPSRSRPTGSHAPVLSHRRPGASGRPGSRRRLLKGAPSCGWSCPRRPLILFLLCAFTFAVAGQMVLSRIWLIRRPPSSSHGRRPGRGRRRWLLQGLCLLLYAALDLDYGRPALSLPPCAPGQSLPPGGSPQPGSHAGKAAHRTLSSTYSVTARHRLHPSPGAARPPGRRWKRS